MFKVLLICISGPFCNANFDKEVPQAGTYATAELCARAASTLVFEAFQKTGDRYGSRCVRQ